MKKVILPLILSLILLAGCSKPETNGGYIKTSDATYSFSSAGGSATIAVTASGDWRAECDASWLSVTNDASTISVVADANEFGRERTAYILVLSGSMSTSIEVFQAEDNRMPVIYRQTNSYVHSQNYRYVGGITAATLEDGTSMAEQYVVLVDMIECKEIFFGPYDANRYQLQEVFAVTDDGDMFIQDRNKVTQYFKRQDGSITPYIQKGTIFSCSADGSVAVGARIIQIEGDSDNFGMWAPIKWVNGVEHILELPETPTRPQYEWYGGAICRGVSADGKLIYATEWNSVDFFLLMWDENDQVHRVAEDVLKVTPVEVTDANGTVGIYYVVECAMKQSNNPSAITPSGKWIAGWVHVESFDDSGRLFDIQYPAFYNTLEHKTHIFWDYPDSHALAARDSDNVGFIRTNSRLMQQDDLTMSDYYTVDIESETTISTTQQWFFDNYGIYPPAKALVKGFSDDNRVALFQYAYISDHR